MEKDKPTSGYPKDNLVKDTSVKDEMKQLEINPHLIGYKKCHYCNRYYEVGIEHPCLTLKRKAGRRKYDSFR